MSIKDYTALDVLALSVQNYRINGFIRSGEGYSFWDEETEKSIYFPDSKTKILEMIDDGIRADQSDLDQAMVIKNKFDSRFMMKKMTGELNDFERSVVKSLSGESTLSKFDIAIIASIPNMDVIDNKRQQVDQQLEKVRFISEYYGEHRQRYDLKVEVIDCKYIQNSGVYMITTLENNKNIIKFWWRDQPDISDIIQGKKIHIRGTVNRHENGKYTGAKETMLNRVKILETNV
jgi:hypothetical protein